jgi:hypothetical protein
MNSNKFTITVGKNYNYTLYIPAPYSWGTVSIGLPLAVVESIDAKVEQMTEFPEVKALLERVK